MPRFGSAPRTPFHISGMRNRIVHVYESSDPETIWAILQVELPKIRTSLDLGD